MYVCKSGHRLFTIGPFQLNGNKRSVLDSTKEKQVIHFIYTRLWWGISILQTVAHICNGPLWFHLPPSSTPATVVDLWGVSLAARRRRRRRNSNNRLIGVHSTCGRGGWMCGENASKWGIVRKQETKTCDVVVPHNNSHIQSSSNAVWFGLIRRTRAISTCKTFPRGRAVITCN